MPAASQPIWWFWISLCLGMDGYAVCREMRSDPLLKEVPILFLTAKAKDEDKIAGFMAGADDYMVKAF